MTRTTLKKKNESEEILPERQSKTKERAPAQADEQADESDGASKAARKKRKRVKSPTISDVAKLAGVSVSVVSHAMNRPEKVSKKKIEAVMNAVKKLNWIPNIRRPGPKNPERKGVRTGNIIVLMLTRYEAPTVMSFATNNELFDSELAELSRKGFRFSFLHAGNLCLFPNLDLTKECDGVIIHGWIADQAARIRLEKTLRHIPAVWCGVKTGFNASLKRDMDFIYYNNSDIGRIAADYLYKRGHRNVALFSRGDWHSAYAERAETFLRQCNLLGMNASAFIGEKDDGRNGFRERAQSFLETSRATGIFACSDDELLGVYNEIRALKGGVPEYDMIGCNNNPMLMEYFPKRPATIDIQFSKIGMVVVNHLIELINGTAPYRNCETHLSPRIIPAEGEEADSLPPIDLAENAAQAVAAPTMARSFPLI